MVALELHDTWHLFLRYHMLEFPCSENRAKLRADTLIGAFLFPVFSDTRMICLDIHLVEVKVCGTGRGMRDRVSCRCAEPLFFLGGGSVLALDEISFAFASKKLFL